MTRRSAPGLVRLAVLGDSFVAGIGDPQHRGWVGRVAAAVTDEGQPVTCYALGVRRQTTAEVLARAHYELPPRLLPETRNGLIVCTGVNDTQIEQGHRRLSLQSSIEALNELLLVAERYGQALVVGPPPVADEDHNDRIAVLSDAFRRVCTKGGIGFIETRRPLLSSTTWNREVSSGDGAHPGAAGYTAFADIVAASEDWRSFCATLRLQVVLDKHGKRPL